MESSVFLCKGCTPWQGFLITGKSIHSLTLWRGFSDAEWNLLKRTGVQDETQGFCLQLWAEVTGRNIGSEA